MKQYQANLLPAFQKKYDLRAKSIFSLILLAIRFFGILSFALPLLFLQHYIVPIIVFPYIRRYVSCALNLLFCRAIFLFLGFLKFQCQNFRFFDRNSPKFSLKSGFIGIGQHKNIIDFIYYSYLFNPVFVRIIVIQYDGKQREILYSPLSYIEAFSAAFSHRGFEPIIISSPQQFKRLRTRKMAMKTLVSECFEQLLGPLLILLPGIDMNSSIRIQPGVAKDIHAIQSKFLRSCVGFSIKYYPKSLFMQGYLNQIDLIYKILGSFSLNRLHIKSLSFRNFRYQYNSQTYCHFIDKYFRIEGKQARDILYEQYVAELNERQRVGQNTVENAKDRKAKHQQTIEMKESQTKPVQLKQKDEDQFDLIL